MWLVGRTRGVKRALLVLADAMIVPACLWVACLLKYDDQAPAFVHADWLYWIAAIAGVGSFAAFGLYRAVTRYVGLRLLCAVFGGACATAGAVWLVAGIDASGGLPASVAIIFGLNVLVWVSATRLIARWLLSIGLVSRQRVVIYGAGEAGARLAVIATASGRMHPVAYVDEKHALQDTTVHGVPVVAPERLPYLVRDYGVHTILLAIPGASRQRRGEVIRRLADLGARVQTVPDLGEILAGRASLADLRDVSVTDLLGRDVVSAQRGLLGANISGNDQFTHYRVYGRSGLLMYEEDVTGNSAKDYVYLGTRLVADRFLCTSALDSDGDGISDCQEVRVGLNKALAADASQDADSDGLTNAQEIAAGTDIYKADTDGDGLSDKYEVSHGLNALVADSMPTRMATASRTCKKRRWARIR